MKFIYTLNQESCVEIEIGKYTVMFLKIETFRDGDICCWQRTISGLNIFFPDFREVVPISIKNTSILLWSQNARETYISKSPRTGIEQTPFWNFRNGIVASSNKIYRREHRFVCVEHVFRVPNALRWYNGELRKPVERPKIQVPILFLTGCVIALISLQLPITLNSYVLFLVQ